MSCPVCGTRIKVENLGSHYGRVHPRDRIPEESEPNAAKPLARTPRPHRSWRRARPAVLAFALAAFAVVIAIAATSYWGSRPAPSLELSAAHYDWGIIPRQNVTATFTVKNVGQGDLVLTGGKTSCMCTSLRFELGSGTSPWFGTHGNPTWSDSLGPGEQGTVVVSYNPSLHPDYGQSIERIVYLYSNDPANPEATIHLQGVVQ